MPGVLTINLNDLIFFGRHGVYEEEKKAGNEFEVNLAVSFVSDEEIISGIDHTINYETLYLLLKKEMEQPSALLETLVTRITDNLYNVFPQIKKISISVHKLHPPIEKFRGRVGVTYEKEF